jgi:hypothetical protein
LHTLEEIYHYLSSLHDENITLTYHFVKRFETRYRIGKTVLKDAEEIKKILLNTRPVYVEEGKQKGEYKVYYEMSEARDLIIVLCLRVASPVKISLITLYPQTINRRLNKNGRDL